MVTKINLYETTVLDSFNFSWKQFDVISVSLSLVVFIRGNYISKTVMVYSSISIISSGVTPCENYWNATKQHYSFADIMPPYIPLFLIFSKYVGSSGLFHQTRAKKLYINTEFIWQIGFDLIKVWFNWVISY